MARKVKGKTMLIFFQQSAQLVLSFYALQHSWEAIQNLRKYEEATKKLAKWSMAAQHQLDKTRTTQAAGAVIAALNALASAVLIILPFVMREGMPAWFKLGASPTMLAMTLASRQYIKNYWAPGEKDSMGKDKGVRVPMPNMEEYNVAVAKTEDLLKVLEYLEYSWAINYFVVLTAPDA